MTIEEAIYKATKAGYRVQLITDDMEDCVIDLFGGDCNCSKNKGYDPKDEHHGYTNICLDSDRHPAQAIDLCLQVAKEYEGREGGFQVHDIVWNKDMTHPMDYKKWMEIELAKDKAKKDIKSVHVDPKTTGQ